MDPGVGSTCQAPAWRGRVHLPTSSMEVTVHGGGPAWLANQHVRGEGTWMAVVWLDEVEGFHLTVWTQFYLIRAIQEGARFLVIRFALVVACSHD